MGGAMGGGGMGGGAMGGGAMGGGGMGGGGAGMPGMWPMGNMANMACNNSAGVSSGSISTEQLQHLRVREHAPPWVFIRTRLRWLVVQRPSNALEVGRDLAPEALVKFEERSTAGTIAADRQQLHLDRTFLEVGGELDVRVHLRSAR